MENQNKIVNSVYKQIIEDLKEYNPENIDINNIYELTEWAFGLGLQYANKEAFNHINDCSEKFSNIYGDYHLDKFLNTENKMKTETEVKKITSCYKCEYKGNILGSVHSSCKFEWKDSKIEPPKANAHGKRNGWYNFPFNYDPIWQEEDCKAYKLK